MAYVYKLPYTGITEPDVSSTNVALLQYSNILPDQHIVSTGGLLYQNKEIYLSHHLFD